MITEKYLMRSLAMMRYFQGGIAMKKTLLLAGILVFIMSNISFGAELPKGTLTREQLTLGYIPIGATPQMVTQVYGQPDRIDDRNGMTYYYGKTLTFSFLGVGAASLYDITATADNGIETADGIGVGMLISKLYDVYGTPNYIRKDKDATRYWYYWERSPYAYFTFTAQNGKIVEISLHYAD
ncbi:hypothetical protein QCO44_05115 [Selenomonas sputigena]|uniref:Uncharacterized protein n=1 Tax=Selenomonas sputigena TaxID=69823 RepID=A0ABV3X4A1_9FIRM